MREVNSKQRLLRVLKIPVDLSYNIVIDQLPLTCNGKSENRPMLFENVDRRRTDEE